MSDPSNYNQAHDPDALRVSQAAIDSSINAIAMASLEGKLSYVNQAFVDLWRLDAVDDALGRSPLEFWEQPQQAEVVVAALQQIGHWQGEMQALRHDGSTATMQLSAHLVRNALGQPICMMSSFVDVSARICAERELLRSEALLSSVIQQIPAMVFLKRASDLRFELLNRAGEELLGLEQATLLGKSDRDFLPPEQAAASVTRDRGVLASGRSLDIPEEAILARNGETRILHTRKIGIYDAAGEPTHLLGISLDITERKRAEAALHEQREFAASLVDAAPVIVVLLDSNGGIQYVNPYFERLSGYRLAELKGREWFGACLPARDQDRIRAFFQQAMHDTPTSGKVNPIITRGGAEREIEWSNQALHDADGNVTALLGIGQDISERRQLEASLKNLNQALEQRVLERTAELEAQNIRNASIINVAMDGFFTADLRGRMLDVNDIYCTMLGYDRAAFLALTIPDIEANESPADVAAHIETILTQGRDRFDTRHRRKDGSLLDVEVNVTLVKLGDEQLFYAFVHDITRRKQAESALIESRDQAERASLAKTEFLSRMSHELRTPLNAILGFAQLLESEPLQQDQAENVREILHAGKHLLEMINEVLDLARVEAGHLDIDIQTVACRPITQSCIATIRPLAAQRGITLVADLATGCAVAADPLRLRQVLLNLLSNAVKYQREGGTVVVSCRVTAGGKVRFSLQDKGIGIAADALPRLFQPFERLETTYSGIEGAGIGLALCKRLVEAMQGTIGANSTLGVGSTFWIELPAADAPAKPRTLLYVDNAPANLRLVEKMMSRYQVLQLLIAATGEAALALARQARPNLILLDIDLPGIDGIQVLRHLKASPATRDIPVVAVAANAMPRDIERGIAAGFFDYLAKPLDVRKFIDLLDRTMKDNSETLL